MADLQLGPTALSIRLSTAEKVGGLLRDVDVPLSAVREVETVSEPLAALRGLRAPGLHLPGFRKVGTWRRPGERTLVSVRRGQPAVRVRLEGQRFSAVLIGADHADEVAAAITAALPAAR